MTNRAELAITRTVRDLVDSRSKLWQNRGRTDAEADDRYRQRYEDNRCYGQWRRHRTSSEPSALRHSELDVLIRRLYVSHYVIQHFSVRIIAAAEGTIQ